MVIEFEQAKNGFDILTIDGKTLHSKYNPEREAEKLVERFLRETEQREKDLLVMGLGMGYHLQVLKRFFKRIYIFEPSEEILRINKSVNPEFFLNENFKFINKLSQISSKNYNEFVLKSEKRFFEEEFKDFKKVEPKLNRKKRNDTSPLKVLLDFPIYGGSLTTAKYTESALKNLGVDFQTMDNTISDKLFEEIRNLNSSELTNQLSTKLIEIHSDLFWNKVSEFKPDICLFSAQSPIHEKLLEKLRELEIITVFWFVEDYRRFEYWKQFAKYFDLFCVIQKDGFFKELKEYDCKNYYYLPMAASEEFHQILDLSIEEKLKFGSDLAFMGAGFLNRKLLFQELTKYNLKIWGTGWNDSQKLKPFVCKNGERVSIEETCKIYNSAKININLHSSQNYEFFEKEADFINPRTFEILACGGFQLVDERNLLPEIFKPGIDLVTFNSLEDLKNKIEFYLNNPEEREIIAKNGCKKVREHHLYKHRLTELFNELKRRFPHLEKKLIRSERRTFTKAKESRREDNLPILKNMIFKEENKNDFLEEKEVVLKILKTFYE